MGFESMTPEQRRALGSKGGQRAQALGKAYRLKPGRHARKIGKLGGLASAKAKALRKAKEQEVKVEETQDETSAG